MGSSIGAAAAAPLHGRDAVLADAAAVLAGGRSLLLQSRAGDGLTAVARMTAGQHSGDGPTIVTGLAGLTGLPLAALVVAGAIPPGRGGDDESSRLRMGLRALQVSARLNGPRLLLVEGIGHLDDQSVSLLVRAVMDGMVQLVAAVPLGSALGQLHPLLSSGAMLSCTVPPLPDEVLRRLATPDTDPADLERVLALADGSPLWFRAGLASGWVDDGAPLPSAMRDLVDWHLSRLSDDAVRVLEMVALAGAVPAGTLSRAVDPRAVSQVRDGAFLRVEGDHMLVRNPIHRARLVERAALQRGSLATALHAAAAATHETLPLLDSSDRPLDPVTAAAMVGTAPRAVLDALDRMGATLPPPLVLTRGRARLETGDAPGAIRDLRSLLDPTVDAAVRADAAMGLSILQAHLLGDMDAARTTIHRTADGIDDPALAGKVRTRQVVIEVYGYGMPQMEALIPDPSVVGPDPTTRLEVLKARAALHAGRAGDLTAEDLPEVLELLAQTSATAAERWEALVPMMYKALMREGFAPALSIAVAELETARARGDLAAIGAWLHAMATALTLGGHLVAARQTIRRAVAALSRMDRFGLSPQLPVMQLRCLARSEGAGALGGLVDQMRPMPTGYGESLRAGALAEVAATSEDDGVTCDLLAECLDHADRIGWPLVGWSQVVTSIARSIPSAPTPLADAPPGDRFVHLTAHATDGDVAAAISALRDLAARGWPAAVAGAARRRSWAAATPRQQLEVQHVLATCQAIAAPVLGEPTGPASTRQLVVAQHAAAGASDADIAAQLNLSRRTVSNHLSRLYDAAGLDGRQDLAHALTPVDVWQP